MDDLKQDPLRQDIGLVGAASGPTNHTIKSRLAQCLDMASKLEQRLAIDRPSNAEKQPSNGELGMVIDQLDFLYEKLNSILIELNNL